MADAWDRLIEMGLPDGAPHRRDPRAFSDQAARAALSSIAVDKIETSRREPLLAWLRGYRHHWPDRWTREMGGLGETKIAELERLPIDENRYLKLRRIAIANLAQLI
jgi:hypothetical protein